LRNRPATFPVRAVVVAAVTAGLAVAGLLAAAMLAPTESTMGDTQRVVYVHVAVAWFGLLAFLVMAVAGLLYLLRRDLVWDTWAGAAAEVGWLCCGLTLLTGSLWAHAAWQTWWTWDPRLTTSFILWMVYSGCLLARGSVADGHHRARIGAVLALLGAADLPLVVMATRWFRGIHPVTPEMEPTMRVALLLSVTGLTAVFALLLVRRQAQLALHNSLVTLLQQRDR
jgi:heme exporter protein C